MQLTNNVGDIGLLPVLLQALVNDVGRITVGPVCVDTPDVDTRLELLEYLAAHYLEALAGFVVFIDCILTRLDGGIALEPGLVDNVIK